MKIAVFSTKPYDQEFLERFNSDNQVDFKYLDVPLNADTANLTEGFEGICVFVNDQVNKEVLNKLSRNGIKLIVLRSAGFNNVDLKMAKEKGIRIFRVPAYSPEAVAEHALALIQTLNRKTHKAYNRIREGNFSLHKLMGFDLNGKTVGVIGTGKIGMIFSRIMKGLGCHVLAFDKYPSDKVKEMGVIYVSLDELLEKSDIISLHAPLNDATKHIINKQSFSKMKNGTMLINTSRGALIDTKDAIDALKTGKLAYLGIDVYEQEEQLFFQDLSESIIKDDMIMRLISFPNVLITAHQGFFTEEALEEIARTTIKNIVGFKNGNPTENEVIFEE